MNNSLTNHQLHRVVTMLNREEIDFLDKLVKDAWFTDGAHLSRTQILRSLVEVLRNLNIEIRNIDSEEELTQKLIEMMQSKTGGVR